MKPDLQERLQERADKIKKDGPYCQRQGSTARDRQQGGGGGGVDAGSVTRMLATILPLLAPQGGDSLIVVPPMAAAARSMSTPVRGATRVIMDSGNLTGAHLISEKSLFSKFDPTAKSVPVMVANEDIEWTQGGGDCDCIVLGPDQQPLGRMLLTGCKYAPSLI